MGCVTHSNALAGGSVFGSSSGPLSIARPQRFWSMLKMEFEGYNIMLCFLA